MIEHDWHGDECTRCGFTAADAMAYSDTNEPTCAEWYIRQTFHVPPGNVKHRVYPQPGEQRTRPIGATRRHISSDERADVAEMVASIARLGAEKAAQKLTASSPTSAKVDHVRQARQTHAHLCHWPGCSRDVPPAMWGCKEHWYRLPKYLRDRIWSAYRPGQESDFRPSREYLDVADEVQRWIRDNTDAHRRAEPF